MGFVYLPALCTNVEIVPLLTIPSVVIMSKDHPDNEYAFYSQKLRKMCINIRDLKDSNFTLPPKVYNSRRYMDRAFEAAGFVPKISVEVKNLDIIISLVAAGLGITATPHLNGLIYSSVVDRINIYNMGEDASPPTTIAAIYQKNTNLTTVARNYLEILTSIFHPNC